MWRIRPDVLRAAVWAVMSLRRVRRQLSRGISRPIVNDPPYLPSHAGVGVTAALTQLSATCLEGALIRQHWLARHGERRDVVIGILPTGLRSEMAHAWVDGTAPADAARFIELHRFPPQE